MKLAICITRSGDDAAVALRMAEAQRLGEAQRCGGHALAQGALAYVTASDALSSVAMLRASQNGSVLAVSGVPTRPRAELDRTLDDVMKGDYRSAGRLLSSLNGAFVVSSEIHRVTEASDSESIGASRESPRTRSRSVGGTIA